jgi:DNA-binding response OmpR family regulator
MVKSVLLADDSLEHCFFFKKALKEVAPDVELIEVYDGDKLVELLESYLPDLLFLDLAMPCRNGVQCIKEIRANRVYDCMPVIVFSVSSDEAAIQAAYNSGADLYIIKPGEYGLLNAALKNILSMDWGNSREIAKKYFKGAKYFPFVNT